MRILVRLQSFVRGDRVNEGWLGDDYLILFDEAEVETASDRYEISQLLPGCLPKPLRSDLPRGHEEGWGEVN